MRQQEQRALQRADSQHQPGGPGPVVPVQARHPAEEAVEQQQSAGKRGDPQGGAAQREGTERQDRHKDPEPAGKSQLNGRLFPAMVIDGHRLPLKALQRGGQEQEQQVQPGPPRIAQSTRLTHDNAATF